MSNLIVKIIRTKTWILEIIRVLFKFTASMNMKYFIHTKDPIAQSSLFERTLLSHEVSCLHLLSFQYVIGLHKYGKFLIIGSYMNLFTWNILYNKKSFKIVWTGKWVKWIIIDGLIKHNKSFVIEIIIVAFTENTNKCSKAYVGMTFKHHYITKFLFWYHLFTNFHALLISLYKFLFKI